MLQHINETNALQRYSGPPPWLLPKPSRWPDEPPMTKKQHRYILHLAGLQEMTMKDLNRLYIKAFNAYLNKIDTIWFTAFVTG